MVLGARLETAPWRLVQVSTRPGLQTRPIDLAAVLGGAAKTQRQPRPSILDIDEEGRRLLIANGSDAWLLALSPLRLQRALRLPGPVDAGKLSPGGGTLYTLRRDSARNALLLGRTATGTGQTAEEILLPDPPLAPIIWQFLVKSP